MRAVVVFYFLLRFTSATAQHDCALLLREFVGKLKEEHRRSSLMFTTHRVITIQYSNGAKTREVIKSFSLGGRSILEGEHFTIYEDAFDRVIIYPFDSLLTLYQRPSRSKVDDEAEPWEKELEMIIELGSPVECMRKPDIAGEQMVIVYHLPKEEKTNFVQRVTLVIEAGTGHPVEITIDLHEGSQIRSKTIEYLRYGFTKVDARLNLSAEKLTERELREGNSFFGFELRDMRQTAGGNIHP
ncbi:MAG: hypothetical protein M3R08_00250 [Bacteroidota bacterium]|nr:hypothetical protein [Bacteroidota bacterium]